MTSARAPAGRVNRNMGKLTATWTKDTVIGLASRLVISQPDAVSNIAVPTFDRTLAVQITVNATELNAPQREGAGWAEPVDVVRSALKFVSSGVPSPCTGLPSTFASERQRIEPVEPRMGSGSKPFAAPPRDDRYLRTPDGPRSMAQGTDCPSPDPIACSLIRSNKTMFP